MAQGDQQPRRGGIFCGTRGPQFYDFVIFRRFDIFDAESLEFENRETSGVYEAVKVKHLRFVCFCPQKKHQTLIA